MGRIAGRGVDCFCLSAQFADRVSQPSQLGDLIVDGGQPSIQKISDVPARRGTAIPDIEYLPDLSQRQSRSLTSVNERHSRSCFGWVVAISVRRTLRRREQAGILIEPQRLRCRPGRVGELSDLHYAPS